VITFSEWTGQVEDLKMFTSNDLAKTTYDLPLASDRTATVPEAELTQHLFNRYTPSKIDPQPHNTKRTLEDAPPSSLSTLDNGTIPDEHEAPTL
jgi:hypothetical protein